jgi:hypothetical protein
MTDDYVELTMADLAHRWRDRTLLEYVDEAAGDTHEEYATKDRALQWTLMLAWSDLQDQRRRAMNGVWSIACDNAVSHILGLTKLIGPIGWEQVQVDLILDGVYERIHELAGTPTPLTEADRRRAREVLGRRGEG